MNELNEFYSLRKHTYIILSTGVYNIFLISAQKHRLWVLVRTASVGGEIFNIFE